MTMGNSWSFVPGDTYKSTRTLVHLLCRVVSRGGNFLLNVGPSPDGDFDPVAHLRLREIGAWMKVNGEAIYGSRPVPPYERGELVFTAGEDGRRYAMLLAKDDDVRLPEQVALPAELLPERAEVTLLGHVGPLRLKRNVGTVQVRIPVKARQAGAPAWVFRIQPPSRDR